ncbi:GL18463 [Drosophila persimilis]|uniref:GL18463 n=1 Tax=Drosophila persimilis TaxID=7234 RepID=B4G7Z6_DROPE|nr:uncharacterized protein LOC6589358 [Drosophila persimilis]EDW29360.1 GL18463 [Drosophila persimilis]
MTEVQKLKDDLSLIYTKNEMKRVTDILDIVNKIPCCHCGHKIRLALISPVVHKMFNKRNVLIAIGAVLGVIPILTAYLTRRYNHNQSHGSSACVSSFFYTLTDCEVVF